MTDIEKIKHLFVPVSERLPEIDLEYLCIKYNEHFGYIIFGCKYEKHQGFLSGSKITHWLDLSILTTKARAEELARQCNAIGFYNGMQKEDNTQSLDKFINENKHLL